MELALVLPFLCFLIAAAVDYARIYYFGVTVENCARNGAYFASNYPNASYVYNDIYGYKTLEEAVLSDAGSIYDPAKPETKPTWKVEYSSSRDGPWGSSYVEGGYVKMDVKWTFHSLTKFPGIPSTVEMTRTVVMRAAPALPTFPGGTPYSTP